MMMMIKNDKEPGHHRHPIWNLKKKHQNTETRPNQMNNGHRLIIFYY